VIVVVTGSRSIKDAAAVGQALVDAITGPVGGWGAVAEVTELWHGGAAGVDRLAAAWAVDHGIRAVPWEVTDAEWQADRRLAGKRRNYRMVKAASEDRRRAIVIGVWDWTSGGTSHALACAGAFGMPVFVRAVRPRTR
jgi:hypothetical protein